MTPNGSHSFGLLDVMAIRFDGRVVVITGAGSGLGKSYAESLSPEQIRTTSTRLPARHLSCGSTAAVLIFHGLICL